MDGDNVDEKDAQLVTQDNQDGKRKVPDVKSRPFKSTCNIDWVAEEEKASMEAIFSAKLGRKEKNGRRRG